MNTPALINVPDGASALDVLALRYRAAFDKMKGGREQWIDGTLELAAVVAEARIVLPAHGEFSRWLQRHGLEQIHPNDRAALIGFAKDLAAARQLLDGSNSISWRVIWEKRARAAPTKVGKGRKQSKHDESGASKRKRARRIPDVMQDDPPPPLPLPSPSPSPPPQRTRLTDYGLTREQVDPDFKGTAVQFAAKYGPVRLYTKDQIEHNKRQDVLNEWLGAVASLDIAAKDLLAATRPDPATLQEWLAKPSKAGKFRAWLNRIQQACDYLQTTIGASQCPSS